MPCAVVANALTRANARAIAAASVVTAAVLAQKPSPITTVIAASAETVPAIVNRINYLVKTIYVARVDETTVIALNSKRPAAPTTVARAALMVAIARKTKQRALDIVANVTMLATVVDAKPKNGLVMAIAELK